MASQKKVAWAELRVGIMAIVALAILAVLIFLLTGSGDIFRSDATLYTYMDDSGAMAPKSQVRLNGILVGSIEEINFSGSKEPGKIVVIGMKLRKDYLSQIPDDSVIEISASNLLGDKFININKGKSATAVKDGGTLKALQTNDIPELMNRAGDLLGSLQTSLTRFDVILADIEAGKGNVGKLIKDEELYNRLNATVADAQKAMTAITSGDGTVAKLLNDPALYDDLRGTLKRVDDMVASVQRGEGTAGKLLKDPALYDDARQSVAELKTLLADLNAGKGTAGKLLKDDQLYRQINSVVAKLEGTVDRINSGQGTIGRLLVDPQLYESLNGATGELHQLLKDIHANPKKFLRIKLAIF
jgi:phospholipid/cholesterol/gamma-HCH transport system substrate-binding protein